MFIVSVLLNYQLPLLIQYICNFFWMIEISMHIYTPVSPTMMVIVTSVKVEINICLHQKAFVGSWKRNRFLHGFRL